LNSKAQPGPDGGSPAVASIGATGSGSSDRVVVITSQPARLDPHLREQLTVALSE
jgi:hypothetical protein